MSTPDRLPTSTEPSRTGLAGEQVFADLRHLGAEAAGLTTLIEPLFLIETGWDPATVVLYPPSDHPLLGRPVCHAAGCAVTAPQRCHVCAGCQRRLALQGLTIQEVGLLQVRARPDRDIGPCLVPDCARQWVSGPAQLCRTHLDQSQELGLSVAAFLAHPAAFALVANEPCQVASCPRQRRHRDGRYCEAHQIRFGVRRRVGVVDEELWRRVEPAIGVGGQVSLRGLPTLVILQVLIGLQRRCRIDAVRTKEGELRQVCDDLRRQQVASIADYRLEATRSPDFAGLVNALIRHARRALSSPTSEVTSDVWDLAVFGHFGTLSFTGPTQPWLREAAKRWAADDLPKRRTRPGRRTSAGLSVRHHVGALPRLSSRCGHARTPVRPLPRCVEAISRPS